MNNFIPDEVIEEIRQSIDIVDLISEYMVLTKKGQNYFGLCPFHGEKTPSFSVSPDKQIYRCFGCGAGGNVFSFVMERESLTFPEAAIFLAEKKGITIPEKKDPKWDKEKEEFNRAIKINQIAKDFYHYVLSKMEVGKGARGYLKERGLTEETIDMFQLGYAPNSWDGLLNFLVKKKYSEEEMAKLGLIIARSNQNGYYDRFRHRVIFPIWDIKGNVIGFGGRILDKGEPKYLNSPESFIYNKRQNLYGINLAAKEIRQLDQVIIVEGYLDVITAHQYGIKNIVASLGTALTKEQVKLIMRYTHDVIVAYDADDAGVNATLRGIEILQNMGCKVKILTIPKGKDPDEFIRTKGPKAFLKLVEEALPLVEYKLHKAVKEYGLNSPDSKVKIVEELATNIVNTPNEVEKEIYLKKVASTLGLQAETVAAEIRKQQKTTNSWQNRDKYVKNRHTTNIENKNLSTKKENWFSARNKGETYLLRMVLENPDLWLEVKARLGINFFRTAEYNSIAAIVDKLFTKNKQLEVAEIYNYVADENTIKALTQLLNRDLPLGNMEDSFSDCINLLEKEILKDKKNQLLENMKQAEKEGNFQLVKELMLELKKIH